MALSYLVRSRIGWRREQSIPYMGVETSSQQTCFKTMRLTAICNGSKRTICASGGLWLLQMVSEPDTGGVPATTLGPQEGWIVRSHISWRGKRNIPYKGVETSPYQTCFITVRLTAIRNGPKRTISTSAVGSGLGCYISFPPLYSYEV